MNTPTESTTEVSEPKVNGAEVESTDEKTPVYTQEKVSVEELKINGDDLVAKVKELIHESNIRRIIIKNEEGRILIEVPLTVGVVGGVIGAALFPVIAAIGAIGALVAHLTIIIERTD
jgi:Domain of unknown function (DUF4342)